MHELNLQRDNLIHWSGEIKLNNKINCGIFADGSGNLTFGIRVQYPGIYKLQANEQYGLFEDLRKMLGRSKPGTLMHCLDFYSVEQYESDFKNKRFAVKYHYRQFDGTSHLVHRSFMFFTYLFEDGYNVKINLSTSAAKKQKGKQPKIDTRRYDSYYKRAKSDFNNKLIQLNGNQYLVARALNLKDIKSVFLNYFNQSYDQWQQFNGQHIQPLSNDRENGRLMVGNQYIGVNTLTTSPDSLSNWSLNKVNPTESYDNEIDFNSDIALPTSFTYPIGLGLPINHVVSTCVLVTEKEKAMKRLKSELGKDRTISYFNGEAYNLKKDLIKGGGSKKTFSELLEEGNSTPVVVSQNIITKGNTLEALADNQEFVSQAYANMGSGAYDVKENSFVPHFFMSNAPGCAVNNKIANQVMLLEQGLCYLPRESHFKSDSRGHLYVDRMGNPLVVDMRRKPLGIRLNNQNKLIFGGSGTGKSVYCNDYIAQLFELNYHFIVLDVGGSYQRTALDMGLRYIDSKDRKSMRFNPFLLCKKAKDGTWQYQDLSEEEEDDQYYTVNAIYAVLDTILGQEEKVDADTKTAVKMAINAYYDSLNSKILNGKDLTPNLTGYWEFLEDFQKDFDKKYNDIVKWERIKLRLSPFAVGEHKDLLNATEIIDVIKDRGVIIDLQEINKDESIKNVVQACITQMAVDKLEKVAFDIPKCFIIDEAVDFLTGNMGEFIGSLFRKIRKVGGEVIIATQDAKFLRAADQLTIDSILSNSDTKILLGMTKEGFQDAQFMLSLTENDLEIINTMKNHPDNKYREVFFKFLDVAMVLRIQLCKQAYWRFTTDPDERVLIDKKVEKYHGNVDLGVEELIKELEK